jgi:hypothetical protein
VRNPGTWSNVPTENTGKFNTYCLGARRNIIWRLDIKTKIELFQNPLKQIDSLQNSKLGKNLYDISSNSPISMGGIL